MELIYGAARLDRRVEGVEDLPREWRLLSTRRSNHHVEARIPAP